MAIYHLSAQIVGKGGGRSAVAAAAYRHCARMERDETAEEIDYSRKSGNAHSEFALPENAPAWLVEFADQYSPPETSAFFWNAVEAKEARKDGQLMREIVLALPVELSTEQSIELVRDFVARELSAHGIAADWAYHDIEDNPHVHLMTALRPVTDAGFGAKRVPVLGDDGVPLRGKDGKIRYEQFAGGLERLREMRMAWAETQNHHLAKHGFDIRVDHRSFEALGIDAVPSKHRGTASDNMDARGDVSELAEKAKLAARENYLRYAEDPTLILTKITTQKAVFTRHDIAREIHRTECSTAEFQSLFYHVGAHEELVAVAAPAFDPFTGDATSEALFSTRTMVELEHRMVQNVDGLARRMAAPIADADLDTAYKVFEMKRGFDLTDQQRMVVRHLTGETGAAALVGYAGAGKSTATEATRIAFEHQGYTVVGGALAGIASDNLRSEAGIESRTLASWEYQWAKGDLLPTEKTVFVMDEAGMVSSRQMESITRTLNEAGARMIVLGDARQLQPIQAGAAFRAFVDVTGYCELDSVVRQHEPWMRDAAIAFGSGRTQEGVAAYLDRDRLDWAESREEARASLIRDWLPYHQASAGVTVMAHRNKDVIALNVDAREALKGRDALGEDHIFASERGEKPFAVGDQILFLKNERSLGVFNGSTGQVVEADRNRLTVLVEGHADPIILRANEYNQIDYGYARTIHKEQGNTVDRAFVYLSPSMDAQLSYVALTRHRDDVTLYAAREDFRSQGELVELMIRDRLQDSTALYRDRLDYREVVRGFAERRGFPTTRIIAEFVKSNLHYLRERLDRLAARFDRLRHPAPEREQVRLSDRDGGRKEVVRRVLPASRPPKMSVHLQHSVNRLSHNLASETIRGRQARAFERSAHYELNLALSAEELRSFNADLRSVFPKNAILTHGFHQPNENAPVLDGLSDGWTQFARDNWPEVFAAQWAETRAELQPLTERSRPWDVGRAAAFTEGPDRTPKRVQENDPASNRVRSTMQTAKPLIDAVPDLPPLEDREIRTHAAKDISARPTLATAKDIAGRIYIEPDHAIERMMAQYGERGDARALISEVERSPSNFGDLRGTTRLGIANGDRRSALEQVPMMARQMDAHLAVLDRIKERRKEQHEAQRIAMRKPLPDLSRETGVFLDQMAQVHRMPSGAEKEDRTRLLLTDKASVQEVVRFRRALTERYGEGSDAIRNGIAQDPALTARSAAERELVQTRVNVVAQAIPVLGQMRAQIRQLDRAPELGKDNSRGIER
ncbi:Ti-type conjugative transfer relaxase TraA [Pelagivirga sediminicola]|uniref:Ti-type conjugative transfer relaxase TraA n=1 Tax=Pelagivirga sediminicola TaxID=2170575 RepID=A0A2T7G2T6_9RHOB|nr:Ti-type conjugative transfer relaxase TraA [Pelagivirga sediminicola]MCQ0090214.1 Ti-type conjugative transfer relaxase TraA [Roseovarius sp. M141]PVA08710.1 Ti-type conjugative transfer relaxase TraA [Pelagivirga sediminicola]